MNGETYNACSIVIAVKNALKSREDIQYKPVKYEKTIEFDCLPEKHLFVKDKEVKKSSVEDWYKYCIEKGLEDIKFLTNTRVKDRNLLAFANSKPNSIICFYKNGNVRYYTAYWNFDKEIQGWHILYKENVLENPPKEKPAFEDPTNEFIDVLKQIEKLARDIGCGNFEKCFEKAGKFITDDIIKKQVDCPRLPEKNLRLFLATSAADVFGGMGSWNDSAPWMAHEKGLEKEYNELSDQLVTQLALAILYSVNEW